MDGKEYIVTTHIGEYKTVAPSAKRAILNIRFKLFRRSVGAKRYVATWTAREANETKEQNK